MVKLAAALLCSLLCTAVYRHFYLQCAQPPPTRSVRAMVQARYDALLMPYFPCFLIVACVACTVALLSSERANRERGLDSWLLGYCATTMPLFFGATHLLTRDLPVAGRCAVYRMMYLSTSLTYRTSRVVDFLTAADRQRFIARTAQVLAHGSYSACTRR